jgi:hypothetical protein
VLPIVLYHIGPNSSTHFEKDYAADDLAVANGDVEMKSFLTNNRE